ncbi:MAG: hypothetical protein U5K43_05990, partial [Halofilum sp. (in: g-proteobacteria)]|nr:hypothetical protein [Halofilum sp. (in: g-proteobacteria)]
MIVEAQLGASRRPPRTTAGMPEQLNGGGFAIDVPPRCREQYGRVPTADEVRPWLETLQRLV